jgi:hypothetical protein
MSASAPLDSCPTCGAGLPATARFCPDCGARIDPDMGETVAVELPPAETGQVPVSYAQVQPRYFGVTPPMVLFGLAVAGVAVAIVLFAAGHWPVALILLGISVLLLAAFLEVARRKPDTAVARVSADALDGLTARTRATLETLAARGRAGREAGRIRRELAWIGITRRERLFALGEATYGGDEEAVARARDAVAELDRHAAVLEQQLEALLAETESRIENARLAVQETQMVEVPEPYPPPDEATIPTPDPVPTPLGPEPSPGPPVPDPVPTPGPGGPPPEQR